MKTIMMATDFSERSEQAMRRATLLAKQFGASIELVHVVDDDQPLRFVDNKSSEADKLLQELADTLRSVAKVSCSRRVLLGSPFAGIIQATHDIAPDLLIIGPYRRQVLRDVFVGTTAERAIRSVACPVLMVNAQPSGQYQHVMQTTDLSDGSRDALRRFAKLELRDQARSSVLYVFDARALRLMMVHSLQKDEQEEYLQDERKDAARDLSAFLARAEVGQIEQVLRYEATAAPHEVLKAAEEVKADLIVMSTHGRHGLAKLLLGSSAEQILRLPTVDVLVVPPNE